MEIVGMGSALVECLRIGRMLERHGETFLARVYTEREIRACQARKHATEHFAAHWAAKEAILDALGIRGRTGLSWVDIEIRRGPHPKPQVLLAGAMREHADECMVGEILLSMAHCRAYATAHALAIHR